MLASGARGRFGLRMQAGILWRGLQIVLTFGLVSASGVAALIEPRPFMVERGHDDGVARDEWVAGDYAKVRRLYTKLGIPERTTIAFFDGPHRIDGAVTYDFLHRHLTWPAPAR